MANDFLSFLGGIGSTPTPVYGTSAEDAALRQQMASGANYWNKATLAQTGYLPGSAGPGSADQTPSQMYAPSYGGNGVARPVQTSAVGPIDRATAANNYFGQALTYVPASGARSVADLLTGIGAYGGANRLGKPETAVAAANQMATGGSPRAYAPWGTYSRSLAYNAFNTPPAPPPNVPLPRSRPGYAPTAIDMAAINRPVGANPGMGGAMIGNGQMSPQIPPQQPPADGSGTALPVWAGTPETQNDGWTNLSRNYFGAGLNGQLLSPGGRQPQQSPTGANAYALTNWHAQEAAKARQANATGTAGGYQYRNGQKVGYAPQTIGGRTYTPTNGATAYGLANVAGQIAALNRQAAATGSTGVYNYVNGVKTGTVNGQSSANAYAAANAGPGSVAEWERRASGNQSSGGGPASGGEYGGGR